MAKQWYYLKDGKTEGPVPEDALKGLFKSGLLPEDTPVWSEGMAEWKKASMTELFSSESKTIPPIPAFSQRYGGFWIRALALLIDNILLTTAIWIITSLFIPFIFMILAVDPEGLTEEDLLAGAGGAYCVYLLLGQSLHWLYYSILESSKWQATIGKKVLGLRVTDEEGRRITFLRATGRYFAKWLSALIFGVGFMMAGWSQKKQALHDRIAKTLVIKGR